MQQDKTPPDKLKFMQYIAHRSELGGICVCLCVSLRHSGLILQEVVSVKKKERKKKRSVSLKDVFVSSQK